MSDHMELKVNSSTLTSYNNFGTPQFSIEMEIEYIPSTKTFILTRGEGKIELVEDNIQFLLAAIPHLRSFFGHNDDNSNSH